VVPGLIASSAAFLVAAGISNSEAQREHRITDDSKLSTMPCGEWMARRIVVSSPNESLASFHDRAVLEHTFDELPVVDGDGIYLGLVAMKSLRLVPQEKWTKLPVTQIMDARARTVCAHHSMKLVEQELAQGAHDYLPVVDPATDHLVGMLSGSDILRARTRVNEVVQTKRANHAKSGLQRVTSTQEE
jgi:CBS-domain-containing membrane protein